MQWVGCSPPLTESCVVRLQKHSFQRIEFYIHGWHLIRHWTVPLVPLLIHSWRVPDFQ